MAGPDCVEHEEDNFVNAKDDNLFAATLSIFLLLSSLVPSPCRRQNSKSTPKGNEN